MNRHGCRYTAADSDVRARADSVSIMIRIVSGFNPQRIRAADYLQRYPFSSLEAITVELETCVEHELMTRKPGGVYAATEITLSRDDLVSGIPGVHQAHVE